MNYIYIDESGDLGSDSNYLIMAAIIVDDDNDAKLNRIINKVRKNNKKQLGNFNEIKGVETKPYIKKIILKKLNKINYQSNVIVFNKKNKYKINYNFNNNLLYDIIASKLAKELFITNKTFIIIDKSKNKEKYRQDFNNLFKPSLNNNQNNHITIEHKDSTNHKGLQIADLISWSFYQSIEHDNNEYIDLIEKNINVKQVYED